MVQSGSSSTDRQAIRLRVQSEPAVNPHFYGFGGYGEQCLWTSYSRSIGITDDDIDLVTRRFRAIRPQIALIHYYYNHWSDERSPNAEGEYVSNLAKTIAWGLAPVYYSQVLSVGVNPRWDGLRAAALRSPSGEITLMITNRSPEDVAVELDIPLEKLTGCRQFVYHRQSLPTREREMIRPSATYLASPGRALSMTVPGEAFVLLTTIED